MSRTYRRKNCLNQDNWIFQDWKWTGNGYLIKKSIDRNSNKGRKLIAEYHSDAQDTMQQVPKWYKVYFCRKPFRRKEDQALIKAVKYIDEDICFPMRKMNAMYYW